MYIVWLRAHDNCHIHYTLHSAIVIARNVFKRSYTWFVNSGAVRGRYTCGREHGDVYTNFKPLARKLSPQTFYIIYIGTFKTAKRLLYLYALPKRRDVGFSFRDESYFCKCSMMMGGAMKLNYCLPFLQCQSFLTIYRGVKGTRWVVSGSKETDNIIVRWTGLCWIHHSRRRLSFSENVEMGN